MKIAPVFEDPMRKLEGMLLKRFYSLSPFSHECKEKAV